MDTDLRNDDPYQAAFVEAVHLRETGNLDESRRLFEQILQRRIQLHGKDHNLTQFAMSQLGRTLRAAGALQEARSLHEEVLRIRRRAYGNANEWTRNSMNVLADTLLAYGDTAAANALRDEAAREAPRDAGVLASPSLSPPLVAEFIRSQAAILAPKAKDAAPEPLPLPLSAIDRADSSRCHKCGAKLSTPMGRQCLRCNCLWHNCRACGQVWVRGQTTCNKCGKHLREMLAEK